MCSRGVAKIVCALTSEEDGLPARLTHTWPPPAPLSHASGVCASCVVWIGRRLDPFRHPRIRTDPPLPPHPGDDASPRSSCPAHVLCPHLRTTTLAPTSSPPPPLPTRPPPSPPWQHWWTACTPSRGCRGGPRSLRPRLVRELWGGGGGEAVGVFALPLSRLTPKNTPSPGVRLALTPLSLLQARAAATAGPLLVQARAAAAVAKSGDKGGAPSFASVAAEVSSLARERRGMGVHPAWVVAAPLAQVRREGAVCGWSAKPSLVFPLCLLPHPPSTIRSPSLPPLSWAFAPWRWPTGPALPLAAPSGRPT